MEAQELYNKLNKEVKQDKLIVFNRILWLYVAGELSILCGAIAYLAYNYNHVLITGLFFGLGIVTPAFMVSRWKKFLI